MMFSYIYKKNQPPFFTVTPHTPNSPVSWAGPISGVCLLTDLLGILLLQKEVFLSEPGRSWKDPVLEDPAICIQIITFLSWKGWVSFTSWSWITKPQEQALQIRFLLIKSSMTSFTKVMGYPRIITVASSFQNQLSFMLRYITFLSLPEFTWLPKFSPPFFVKLPDFNKHNSQWKCKNFWVALLFIYQLSSVSFTEENLIHLEIEIQCYGFFNKTNLHFTGGCWLDQCLMWGSTWRESGSFKAILHHRVEALVSLVRSLVLWSLDISRLCFVWIWGPKIIRLKKMCTFYDFSGVI